MTDVRLPAELWREVFLHAIHVPELLSMDWDYDPDDQVWRGWKVPTDLALSTKRTIVQVCREWRALGIEFLYEAIQIHAHDGEHPYSSLESLVAVLRASSTRMDVERSEPATASSPNQGYGWWIKRIDFTADLLFEANFAYLTSLLNQCHNVSILTIEQCDRAGLSTLQLAPFLEDRFSHSLRRLDIELKSPQSLNILIPSLSLRSLDIALGDHPSDLHTNGSFETISTLAITLSHKLVHYPERLYFPSLRNLSLRKIRPDDYFILNSFVHKHRETLRSLHLQPSLASRRLLFLIPQAINLRTLTFDEADLMNLTDGAGQDGAPTSFPGITHLGILEFYKSHYLRKCRLGIDDLLDGQMFPDLVVIRLLDHCDTVPFHRDWVSLMGRCRDSGIRLCDGKGEPLTSEEPQP